MMIISYSSVCRLAQGFKHEKSTPTFVICLHRIIQTLSKSKVDV